MATPVARRRLTALEERFVAEYLIDLNGTQAYLRSHPDCKSVNSAGVLAIRLLRKARVRARVAASKARHIARLDRTAENLLTLIWDGSCYDPMEMLDDEGRLLPMSRMPAHVRRQIEGVEVARANLDRTDGKKSAEWLVKIKMVSKSKMRELMAQHFGLVAPMRVEVGLSDELFARLDAGRERVALAAGTRKKLVTAKGTK